MVYGKDHPNIVDRLNDLAQLLHDTNSFAEAEQLFRHALAINEASFGKDHPSVATALNNLALLLRVTNRLAEAEPLMRRALAIDQAAFGPTHPKVAIRLDNLAKLLQSTNRLAEAEPLLRQRLEILVEFTRASGHPHSHLQLAMLDYDGLLNKMDIPLAQA